MTNINLEFGAMTCSAEDPALRIQAIDLTKRWVDHAVVLGSPRVMINQGQLSHENKRWAIDALRHDGGLRAIERGVGSASRRAATGIPAEGAAAVAPPAPAAAGAARPAPPAAGPGRGGRRPRWRGRCGGGGGGGGGRGTIPPAPPLTVVPAWVLLSEVIQDSGTYANVDMGNVAAQTEGELFAAFAH